VGAEHRGADGDAVDKQSGRVVGSPLRVGEISGQIAAADGTVWVAGVHDLIRTRRSVAAADGETWVAGVHDLIRITP
jgi:hypothetical protein